MRGSIALLRDTAGKLSASVLFMLLTSITVYAQAPEEDGPFKLSVSYIGDVFMNTTGGANTGIVYLDNIDVNLEANFETLPFGLSGTTFYVYGLGNQGNSISSLAGDVQGVSNIEAENSWRFFEFWVQKKFFLANSSLLVGLYDINSEFNALNSSLLFLNSSSGLDPTIALSGEMGPSTFPHTSLGVRLKVNMYKGIVFQGAVLDGVPSNPENSGGTKVFLREEDGLFFIGELALHSLRDQNLQMRNRTARLQEILSPGNGSDNNIGIGGWYYSRKTETWDGSGPEQEYGIYALGEYELLKREGASPKSIKVFARAGWTNSKTNMLDSFYGGGMVFKGLLPSRSADETGIAAAHARGGTGYLNNIMLSSGRTEKAETNIELTHQFVLNDYAKIRPNVQYVINPGFNETLDNALVTGIRLNIGF
ncbi:MAG TPA: carbohydrate porin [Gracilimonas sp.]|uniref:carbohydrate porin n=1 Tax=Gracilimonas sp. TaxID=1974203 RepID=UPI002DA3D02C|nr:carbohydrate porin [Gracilimonas sp.]